MVTTPVDKVLKSKQLAEAGGSKGLANARVLVVEDDAGHAAAIQRALKGTGAEIRMAGTLLEYRRIIAEWPPDIALMDLNLPDGRTLEVLASPMETVAFPILVMTSHGNEETVLEVMKAGALDYVVKAPLVFEDIPRILARGLREWNLLQERARSDEALRASEERYRRILNSTAEGIYGIDLSGNCSFCNPAAARLLGYPGEQELLGRNMHDLVHHSLRDGSRCDKQRCVVNLAGLNGYSFHSDRESLWRAEGTRFPAEIWAYPIMEKGISKGAVVSFVDISERVLLEEQLQHARAETEHRHDELKQLFAKVDRAKAEWERTMDCINDVVMLTDKDGNIIRCNRALKRIAAGEFQDFIGRNWEEVIFGRRAGKELHDSGQVEVRLAPNERWLTVNSYPFKNWETNEPSGHVITLRDTTEIRILTESLEQTNITIDLERRELREALDQLSGLIQRVMETGDLGIRYPNPNLEKCFEVMHCGKKSCSCFGGEPVRCWQVSGTYCGGKISGEFVNKYGKCSACPVYKNATESTVLLIGEHFNNMMHMLEEKNLQLQGAYSELKSAQSQALQQEKMASIGQLAAGVAHEINNPMGFIMSNLAMMQDYVMKLTRFLEAQALAVGTDCGKGSREQLKELRKELNIDFLLEDAGPLVKESLEGAERVKKIVEDLKGFSRAGGKDWKPSDINAGIESTLNIVWNELKYKALVSKEYGVLPLVLCNMGQLNQVFMNLLVNAAQAIENQGEIRIKTEYDGRQVIISISDSGAGISPEIQQQIFDPFFTTKAVGKGTGLGLSIAYDIVKKNKGDIAVKSEPGKGTVFTISIPVTVEA